VRDGGAGEQHDREAGDEGEQPGVDLHGRGVDADMLQAQQVRNEDEIDGGVEEVGELAERDEDAEAEQGLLHRKQRLDGPQVEFQPLADEATLSERRCDDSCDEQSETRSEIGQADGPEVSVTAHPRDHQEHGEDFRCG